MENNKEANKSNPNINEEAKEVWHEFFGLTSEECDNLDPECSFVSPSFLRERRERKERMEQQEGEK